MPIRPLPKQEEKEEDAMDRLMKSWKDEEEKKKRSDLNMFPSDKGSVDMRKNNSNIDKLEEL